MTDAQPEPTSPWAPESSEPAEADGAVLRSPAPPADGAEWPWEADPENAPPRVAAGPAVKTERLYRSGGFTGDAAAENPLESTAAGSAGVLADAPAAPEPYAAPAMNEPTPSAPPAAATLLASANKGLKTLYVALLITGVTTIAAVIDMVLNRQLTMITGITFIVVCIIAALKVRPSDLWTAVITPPLAFLVALIISGQVTAISGSGDLLLREATVIATGLAFNAPYVFGGTIAALVIVLIRRPKAKAALRSTVPAAAAPIAPIAPDQPAK